MKKWLECPCCHRKFELNSEYLICPDCSRKSEHYELNVCYDYEHATPAEKNSLRQTYRSIWGYKSFLPVADDAQPVTLGEGATPLTRFLTAEHKGYPQIWCKNESQNPTWSHKDRLNSVLATTAKAMEQGKICCSSTGNHGLSAAAYAGRSGGKSIILFPPETPKLMVDLASSYGAVSVITEWHARDPMLRHLISKGWFPFTSPKDSPTSNPYGGEGYKTIAYEIVTDLGRVPDKMLVPVAAGALICGAYKGFLELKTLGITDKIPQFVACQAKGANVLQRAFDAHSHETERMPGAFSIATSTREETVGSKALQVIYESGGSAMVATDYEIQQAMITLGKEGYCAEAASAIPFACSLQMIEKKELDPEECCVCILTSGGVKSPDILADLRAPAVRIEGSVEALEKAVSLYC